MLLLALAALASPSPITKPLEVNVDADAALERLVPEVVRDGFGFEQRRVVLEDACGRFALLPAHDTVTAMRAREADGVTETPEIVVEGRSGASGRAGMLRLIRFAGCRRRTLFSYSSLRPARRPPRGWYVAAYNVRPRRAEIRLDEYLARNSEPAIAAGRRRVSTWRLKDGRFARVRVRFARP